MTAFAGIDFDTNAVHVVLLPEEGLAEYRCFVLPKGVGDAFERTRRVRDVMPSRSWWVDEGIVAIGIEEPMGQSTRPLNRVQGAILACLPTDLLVHPMRPGEWRKACELRGNAEKLEIAAWVHAQRESYFEMVGGTARSPQMELVALEPWPQDAADAYCMARAVQSLTVVS